MLNVDSISVAYGGAPALHDVSFQVIAGEIVLISGSNGAGKTTLMNAISGVVGTTHGSISLLGDRLDKLRPERIAQLGVIQCPEGRRLFANLSVEENLKIASISRGVAKDVYVRECEEIAKVFPLLQTRRRELAGNLSGGEQQMIAIARSMVAQPKVLLLDEPCTGLAEAVAEGIPLLIKRAAAKGVAVLWADERLDRAIGVVDRTMMLNNGRMSLEPRS